jgi:cysteine-rich repeat protein
VSLNLCGDGTINNGEQCDDAALGGGTCMLEGFDNGTLSCSSTCTYDTSTCTYELGVSTSGTGMGTVTSDVGGINCGATCTAQYAANDVVTLTATPTAGSEFTGWTGACTGSGACMVTMSDTKTVDAAFAPLCGNGMIDGTEQCDDMDLGTATCSTATMGAMTTGTLGCQADCTFDTTACTP